MISRVEKIRELSRRNRQRRNLEIIVPQLQKIFGGDFAESNIKIVDSKDWPGGLSRDWLSDFHYVWSYDDLCGIENFCDVFLSDVGNRKVKVVIPKLDTGVLEINLSSVFENLAAFLEVFNFLWFYEPESFAEFEIQRHAYYYYGENARIPKEFKWEMDLRGFWAPIARNHLTAPLDDESGTQS